jgi:hypothetical protein
MPSEQHDSGRRFDRRTRAWRRAKIFEQAFLDDLGTAGSLSEVKRHAIRRAAELLAAAEDTRARRLAGDQMITTDDITRLEGAARRAVLDAGLLAPGAAKAADPVAALDGLLYGADDDDDGGAE